MNNYEAELWTSASILFVHAAIAFTDALTIKAGSVKSAGDDHAQVIYLVEQTLFLSTGDKIALNRLGKILGEKSKVSYGGKVYSRKQADKIISLLFNRTKSHSLSKLTKQITPPTKNGHTPPPIKSKKNYQSINPHYI